MWDSITVHMLDLLAAGNAWICRILMISLTTKSFTPRRSAKRLRVNDLKRGVTIWDE